MEHICQNPSNDHQKRLYTGHLVNPAHGPGPRKMDKSPRNYCKDDNDPRSLRCLPYMHLQNVSFYQQSLMKTNPHSLLL